MTVKRGLVDKLWSYVLGLGVTLSFPAVPSAEAANAPSLSVPASDRQLGLSVEIATGSVRAETCHAGKCDDQQVTTLDLPTEARAHGGEATLRSVEVAKGRSVVLIRVPSERADQAWEAIVAAPLRAGKPLVIFSGLTGLVNGELGERGGPLIETRGQDVLVGQQREDVRICGRPTMLGPKLLNSNDFSLHAAKLQRLSLEERKNAVSLRAERSAGLPEGSPLHALAASSAIGSPQALTDGDPNSYWGENRGGDGRGEFVVLGAPKELPLTAFDLLIRPAPADSGSIALAHGAAPKQFWLATTDQLFSVTLPEDAWQKPGVSYRVALPRAIQSDCVALVLESSFSADKNAQVVVAELAAETALSTANPTDTVRALNGGGERALAAAAALRFGGTAAFSAVAEQFSTLDERGRELGLDVIDKAPCPEAARVYVAALVGPYAAQRDHAASRLERCRDAVAKQIGDQLDSPAVAADGKIILASQLPGLSPGLAAAHLPALLDNDSPSLRAAYRDALAAAGEDPAARAILRDALVNRALAPRARLEVVRALAAHGSGFAPQIDQAFADLVHAEPPFERQFLLLDPAAKLAGSDASARAFLSDTLSHAASPYLRAEAASRANPTAFESQLVAALGDPDARVRKAAVESLAYGGSAKAGVSLIERLKSDPWPMVRAEAARALARLPASSTFDQALARALHDESRHVRLPAAIALGERRAKSHVAELRDVLANSDEDPYVRAAAATALGITCDAGSVDLLTAQTAPLKSPQVSEYQLLIARSSLMALADLAPNDLAARLASLSGREAPAMTKRVVREALAKPGRCRAIPGARGDR